MKTSRRGGGSGRAPAARQFEHHGGSRGVVVGPVVDLVREHRQRSGHEPAVPQVVVMPADHDRLIGMGTGPFQHPDDVLGVDRRGARSKSSR